MLSIKEILPNAMHQTVPDQKSIIWSLDDLWEQIVGAPLARQTRPLSIKEGKLKIGVVHSTLANELIFLQSTLIERIKKEIPSLKVSELRFQIMTSSSGSIGLKTSPERSFGKK
ncbi:MAG: DUF721 domain-containing protein [Deltaproteobacteria bacterium]|nr:DUF721 domain-containing protein [Deltaproteobacteria bacterium]